MCVELIIESLIIESFISHTRSICSFAFSFSLSQLCLSLSRSLLIAKKQPTRLNVYKNDNESYDYTNPNLGMYHVFLFINYHHLPSRRPLPVATGNPHTGNTDPI